MQSPGEDVNPTSKELCHFTVSKDEYRISNLKVGFLKSE